RLGSAIVFSAVMMAGLLWNEIAFAVLILVIMLLCLREFFTLIKKIHSLPDGDKWIDIGMLSSAVLSFSAFYFFLLHPENTLAGRFLFVLSAILITLILLISLLQKNNLFPALVFKSSALFYIVMPMLMLLYLRHISLSIPLALILMIWMNDTMAYLTGSFIGKTPFSKISPK